MRIGTNPGDFTGPIPEDGKGWGYQFDAIVSYRFNDWISVGAGGRYWHVEAKGHTHFEGRVVGVNAQPQVVHWRADHFGGFIQANIKFGPYPVFFELDPLACARQPGRRKHPTRFAMDRLYRATINTWNGLKAAIRTEAAFRQEIAVLLVAIPLAFVIGQTAWTRLALVGVVVFVMVVELLNTAIEKLADRVIARIRLSDRHRQGHRLRRGRPVAAARRRGVAARDRAAAGVAVGQKNAPHRRGIFSSIKCRCLFRAVLGRRRG